MHERAFDIVLFGATGFTGRLVAEYFARHRTPFRWAMAGRSRAKLEALGFAVPVLVGDALDQDAMRAIAGQARVVCTAVGPYTRFGAALIAACADTGTHYCDLAGEVPWMRRMIDLHDARARATGARIVPACGFDSIPSDLGVFLAQAEMARRFGQPAQRITGYFEEPRGGFGGGTIGSAVEIAESTRDPAIRALLANPYGLDPDPHAARAPSPDPKGIGWDRASRQFTTPFVMAFANTRIVRRSHALAGFPYGPDFVYRELMTTPATPRGLATALGVAAGLASFPLLLRHRVVRGLIDARLPKPGEGPSAEARAKGHWRLRLVAEGPAPAARLSYIVADRAEPGFESTAKMLGESALSLAFDRLESAAGFLTPSIAMGAHLPNRLRAAGLTLAPEG